MRALAADGISQREIAARLGVHRQTVKRMLESDAPPRYERKPQGSMLDPLGPVIRATLEECPDIKAPRMADISRDGYGVRGLGRLGAPAPARLRPRTERAAQRTGYRPGQVPSSTGSSCRPAL